MKYFGVAQTRNYYRSDIDGLRAIAVFQVLVFHAGFPVGRSGFIGVDIFFVISGFLITGILLKMQEDKTFKLRHFFERRIRRILPALFSIILISTPVAYYLMLPDDLENFGQSEIAATFSINNFLLWLTENYFSVRNEFKPLVHTWSLGVEEQFYFFYPFFVIFAFKIKRKIPILFSLTFLWILSFSLSVWCSVQISTTSSGFANLSVASFYLLPTRAFELLTGAITFLTLNKFESKFLSEIHRGAIKLAGFLIIIASGLFLPKDVNYPNYLTMLPLLGAVMFLIVRSEKLITPFITQKIILRIGLASYSIYLIHQPLFAFYRLSKFEAPNNIEFLILILVSIFLGLLSFKYIETPFRSRINLSYRKVISVLTIMAILILVSGSQFVLKAGYYRGAKFFPIQTDLHRGQNAEFNLKPFALKKAAFLEPKKVHVLVIGNSQARDFVNAIQTTSLMTNLEIVYRDDFEGCIDSVIYKQFMINLIEDSNYIVFGSAPKVECWNSFKKVWRNRINTILILGEKNFGVNLNAVMIKNVRSEQQFDVRKSVIQANLRAQKVFGKNFIDMNNIIGFSKSRVPILDSSGFLISQDATHLTPK